MSHTPGPWIVGSGATPTTVFPDRPKTEPTPMISMGCGQPHLSIEEMIANAHLIAAAPEMLEALKEAAIFLEPALGLSYSKPRLAAYSLVKNAITKAEEKWP